MVSSWLRGSASQVRAAPPGAYGAGGRGESRAHTVMAQNGGEWTPETRRVTAEEFQRCHFAQGHQRSLVEKAPFTVGFAEWRGGYRRTRKG